MEGPAGLSHRRPRDAPARLRSGAMPSWALVAGCWWGSTTPRVSRRGLSSARPRSDASHRYPRSGLSSAPRLSSALPVRPRVPMPAIVIRTVRAVRGPAAHWSVQLPREPAQWSGQGATSATGGVPRTGLSSAPAVRAPHHAAQTDAPPTHQHATHHYRDLAADHGARLPQPHLPATRNPFAPARSIHPAHASTKASAEMPGPARVARIPPPPHPPFSLRISAKSGLLCGSLSGERPAGIPSGSVAPSSCDRPRRPSRRRALSGVGSLEGASDYGDSNQGSRR